MNAAVRAVLLATAISVAIARPAYADRFDPDGVQCAYQKHGGASMTSNETLNAWLARYTSYDSRPTETRTRARDRMSFDFSVGKNFVGHVGGGGGARVVYDPRHRIVALCQVYDTAQGFYVFANAPVPPFAVATADLDGFATEHGIRIGSTIADVKGVYGPAEFVNLGGSRIGLSYVRVDPPAPGWQSSYSTSTWFEIAHGKVVAIARITGF